MEKRKSPQYLAEELAAKRRLSAIHAAAGLASGAAAGTLTALLGGGLLAAALQASLLVAGYVGVELYARGKPWRSLARGVLAYLPSYLLGLFSLYAALIR